MFNVIKQPHIKQKIKGYDKKQKIFIKTYIMEEINFSQAQIESLEAKNQELELQLQKERIEKEKSQTQLEQEVKSLRLLLFTVLQQEHIKELIEPSFEQQADLPALPKAGEIPLYKDRDDKNESAVDFFKRVYKRWLDAGVIIYQFDLRKKTPKGEPDKGIDPSLSNAIEKECRKKSLNKDEILPTKKIKTNRHSKDVKNSDLLNEPYKVAKIAIALHQRSQRAKRKR